jgi:hypothetical protein
MDNVFRVPFSNVVNHLGETGILPLLPLQLNYREKSLEVSARLDTGAMVNVLPWSVGLELGAVWENQAISLKLSGNLSNLEARALLVAASIGDFPPVQLAFAWTKADNVPILLGMTNFFMEFDVCVFRSQSFFDVRPKGRQ